MGDKSKLTRREVLSVMAASTIGSMACTPGREGANAKEVRSIMSTVKQHPLIESIPLPTVGPWPTLDPFLFCVHHNDDYPSGNTQLGPNASLSGRQMGQDFANKDGWNMYHGSDVPGFPCHPHRGFETVTVVKKGIIDHADSLGAKARYGDGDVQWLTAGDGINHAEMFPLLESRTKNPIDFFQIWLNLPAEKKRVPPHFSMFWATDVPLFKHIDAKGNAVEVAMVSGSHFGMKPPSPPPNSWAHAPGHHVSIMRIDMPAHSEWTLPPTASSVNRCIYVAEGSVRLGESESFARCRLTLKPDLASTLNAESSASTLLLLEGQPIGEPVVKHGPFVMNTRAEIMEAFSDYRRTRFGGWPWTTQEPVHGSDRKRFAVHADGRIERPS